MMHDTFEKLACHENHLSGTANASHLPIVPCSCRNCWFALLSLVTTCDVALRTDRFVLRPRGAERKKMCTSIRVYVNISSSIAWTTLFVLSGDRFVQEHVYEQY